MIEDIAGTIIIVLSIMCSGVILTSTPELSMILCIDLTIIFIAPTIPTPMDMVIRHIVPDGIDRTDPGSMPVLIWDLVGATEAMEGVTMILSSVPLIPTTVGTDTMHGVLLLIMEDRTM